MCCWAKLLLTTTTTTVGRLTFERDYLILEAWAKVWKWPANSYCRDVGCSSGSGGGSPGYVATCDALVTWILTVSPRRKTCNGQGKHQDSLL